MKEKMNKYFHSELWKKDLICFLVTFIGTLIYAVGVMWFLNAADLYSGGVTGCAQLVVNLIRKLTGSTPISLGVIVMLFNVPILVLGWRGVSKRFAIFSVISIVLQTIFMSNLLTSIIPIPNMGINAGVNPITGTSLIPGTESQTMDLLLLSMVGGFICGVGNGICLRYGSSTGGVDIIAQAFAFKKNISVGYFSLIFNVVIAILGSLLGGTLAILFYTIVRIIAQSIVTDKIHTAYNHLRVEIITEHGSEIAEKLISELSRGVTLMRGKGGYSKQEKDVLETIVSSYEIQRVIDIAKSVDPKIFVSVSPIKRIAGKYQQKTIN